MNLEQKPEQIIKTIIKNEAIKSRFVKVVDNDKMIGILSLNDALNRAKSKGLDLVLVVEGEQPVCHILNADRYRFERSKNEREQARKKRILTVETKEINLRPVTGTADILIKAKHAKEFLESGDRVKVVLKFRGREKSHKDEGINIITKFVEMVGEHKVERPLMEGEAELTIILASNIVKSDLFKKKNEQNA